MTRALVLYTLSPYDRSFWSCVRDPLWLLFTLVAVLPYVGPVFWLCLYAAKDRSDEHQLCDFILSFKAAQFAGVGVLSVARGIVLYLICTSREPPTCEVEGPRLQSWDAAFFALQILLVWAAFRALPHTRAARRPSAVSHESLVLRRGSLPAGGHLFRLFWYDSAVLLTSSLLLLGGVSLGGVGGASFLDLPRWNTRAALYWTRALYGVLAAPFVPFKMPLLGALLTHAARTGYDPHGRTMLLQRRVPFLREPVGGDYARPSVPPPARGRAEKVDGTAQRSAALQERAGDLALQRGRGAG